MAAKDFLIRIRANIKDAESKLNKLSTSAIRRLEKLKTVALGVAGGVLAAGAAFGVWFRSAVTAARGLEQITVQLEAIEGSGQRARDALAWIQEFSTETPFTVEQVSDAFVQLRAFGLDPMDGTLQAIADRASTSRDSLAALRGISLAVGQAWSKQRLQGEEILQLIERGVPVWELLEKVTGKNAVQIQKLSEEGKLGRPIIAALVKEIGELSNGAALKRAKTLDGVINNLGETFTQINQNLLSGGVLDYIKAIGLEIQTRLNPLLKTSQGESTRFANLFINGANGIIRALGYVGDFARATIVLFKGIENGFNAIRFSAEALSGTLQKIPSVWLYNKIFGEDFDQEQHLKRLDELGQGLDETSNKLKALLLSELPSDKVDEALASIQEHLEELQRESAETTDALNDIGNSDPSGAADTLGELGDKAEEVADKIKKLREALAAGPEKADEDLTVLDPIGNIDGARAAAQRGEAEEALKLADRAVEQLDILRESGSVTPQFLNSLTNQVAEVVASLPEKVREATEQADAATVPLKVDPEETKNQAAAIRNIIQTHLKAFPVEIPVTYTLVDPRGDKVGSASNQDFTKTVATEAAKAGGGQ